MAGGGQGGDHPWREYLAEATAGGPRGFAGEEGAREVDFMSPPPMAPRCCLSTRSTCWTSRASPSSTGPWRVTWHLSSSWPPTAASPGENGRAGWQEGHRVNRPGLRSTSLGSCAAVVGCPRALGPGRLAYFPSNKSRRALGAGGCPAAQAALGPSMLCLFLFPEASRLQIPNCVPRQARRVLQRTQECCGCFQMFEGHLLT